MPKVFCLEGEWSGELSDEQSVVPLLEVLRHTAGVGYIHRRVGTRAELERLLGRWRSHTSYATLYLAFHGERGDLELDEMVGLETLAEMLGPSCEGAMIHLSACQSLRVSEEAVASFLRDTRADGLLGYEGDVKWIEGAALDLIVLEALADRSSKGRRPSVPNLVGILRDHYPGLVKRTTFSGRPLA